MSIIHDALKKVQDNFNRKAVPPESAPVNNVPEEQEKKPFSFFNAFLAFILLCVCLFFGYNQLLKHWDNIRMAFDLPNVKLKKIEIPKISISTSDSKETKTRTLSENRTPVAMAKIKPNNAQETLNVQGILRQGDKTVVLINDKIYEEGDEIGNIKITQIESYGITVLNEGKEEQIRVH